MDYSPLWCGIGVPIDWQNEGFKNMNRSQNMTECNSEGKVKPVCSLKSHLNDVTSVDFSGKNLLATGSSDKTIRLYKWCPEDKFEELSYSPLTGHRYGINCICFSPFGTKLASASTDGQTFIWDVKTGENLISLHLSGEAAGVRTCAFSPNAALLATGGDGNSAAIWDVCTFSLIREISGHESTITSVAFAPDSNYLATGSSIGDLRIWDGMYGHALPLVTKVEVHDLGITCLHFSPTIGKEEDSLLLGKRYLFASGGQDTDLHLWVMSVGTSETRKVEDQSSASVNLYHTLCGHTGSIMMVRFSSSGLILASASGDKTVRLWDVIKLAPIGILEDHSRYVTSCAFSEDGNLIAAGGGDRYTHIWRVSDVTDLHQRNLSNSGPQNRRFLNKFPGQKFRENKKMIQWTMIEVCEWLGEQGLGEYSPNFKAQAIDGREMISLTDPILEFKLGVDALGHRNKILRFVSKNAQDTKCLLGSDDIPAEFVCPITQELMRDPVLCADGFSYEREAIEAWLANGKKTSPMTNEILAHMIITPNRNLKSLIRRHKEENT